MDLLRVRELTSIEIASEINIPKDNCSVYLNTLYNDGRIKRTSNKRPYKYKLAKESTELLKFLNDFFKDNIEYLMKNPKIKEFILEHEEFDEVEEVLN